MNPLLKRRFEVFVRQLVIPFVVAIVAVFAYLFTNLKAPWLMIAIGPVVAGILLWIFGESEEEKARKDKLAQEADQKKQKAGN